MIEEIIPRGADKHSSLVGFGPSEAQHSPLVCGWTIFLARDNLSLCSLGFQEAVETASQSPSRGNVRGAPQTDVLELKIVFQIGLWNDGGVEKLFREIVSKLTDIIGLSRVLNYNYNVVPRPGNNPWGVWVWS